jgi:hypothetical protein
VRTKYPESAADWADSYSIPINGGLLAPMQDAPGALAAADVISGRDLDADGVTFGVAGEGGRTAVSFDAITAALICNDAAFGDPSEGPIWVWARLWIPESTSVKALYGKLGADPRWYVNANYNTETVGILIDDAVAAETATIGHLPDIVGQWLDVIAVVNRDAERITIATPFGRTTATFGSADGDLLSPIHAFAVGGQGGQAPVGLLCGYLAHGTGHALTLAEEQEIFRGPGPAVSNVLAPGEITRTTPLVFDVTDGEGLRRVLPSILFPGRPPELAHDGEAFTVGYVDDSTRTAITGGWRYSLLRRGGWPAPPTLRVYALDTHGNEAP